MKKLFFLAALLPFLGLTSCATSTVNSADSDVVRQAQANISSVQPIPDLRFSIQREALIDAYRQMSIEQPFFMIATSNDGKIIATAVVKGCVPATFQLTNPEVYVYNGATLPQAEVNALFTGDTPATYCSAIDGTFFYVEHLVAFSTKPFPDALTSSAAINFTPNVRVNKDGTVTDVTTGKTY
jgi:hypothetical protein